MIIPAVKGKIKVNHAPAIPTGAPTILTEEIVQIPPLVALKTIKTLSMVTMSCHNLTNVWDQLVCL